MVVIGEIGGTDELAAADAALRMAKPVVAYVAGKSAPQGKRMGHAGAIVAGGQDTAAAKINTFRRVGVRVADLITDVAPLIAHVLHG